MSFSENDELEHEDDMSEELCSEYHQLNHDLESDERKKEFLFLLKNKKEAAVADINSYD